MKRFARIATGLLMVVASTGAPATAVELDHGINTAGIIKYPTALNQPTTHTIHGTLELTDIGEPDLNLYNLRYGLQLGGFQFLADLNYALGPIHEADYAEIKGKMQLLNLEEFRLAIALGLLGRVVKNSEEKEARIDGRSASLFGILSVELFPFDRWGGFLVNFYLDNRVFELGGKVQLFNAIQAVVEGEIIHSTLREDDRNIRGGISIDGGKSIYFQFLVTDEGENYMIQIGGGF